MLYRSRAHRSRSLPRRPHRRNRRKNAAPLRSRTGSPPRHSTIRRWIWYISWNDGEPKYDIRDWSPDGTRMGKGISLSHDELAILKGILEDMEL